jgi:hypothetical protein
MSSISLAIANLFEPIQKHVLIQRSGKNSPHRHCDNVILITVVKRSFFLSLIDMCRDVVYCDFERKIVFYHV